MDLTTLAVAGMSLIGTLAGTFGGILVSNKLTTYRIEQLEQKVAAHNSLVERTYKLEMCIRDRSGAVVAVRPPVQKGPHRDHEGRRLAVPVQWLRLGVVLLSAGLSGP